MTNPEANTFDEYYSNIVFYIEDDDVESFVYEYDNFKKFTDIEKFRFESIYFREEDEELTTNNIFTDYFCLTLEHQSKNIMAFILSTDLDFNIPLTETIGLCRPFSQVMVESVFSDKRILIDTDFYTICIYISLAKIEVSKTLFNNPKFDSYENNNQLTDSLIDKALFEAVEELLKLDPKNDYKVIQHLRNKHTEHLRRFDKYNKQFKLNVLF